MCRLSGLELSKGVFPASVDVLMKGPVPYAAKQIGRVRNLSPHLLSRECPTDQAPWTFHPCGCPSFRLPLSRPSEAPRARQVAGRGWGLPRALPCQCPPCPPVSPWQVEQKRGEQQCSQQRLQLPRLLESPHSTIPHNSEGTGPPQPLQGLWRQQVAAHLGL